MGTIIARKMQQYAKYFKDDYLTQIYTTYSIQANLNGLKVINSYIVNSINSKILIEYVTELN